MCVLERAIGAAAGCRYRVPLQGAAQGAAVRVVCAPWRWHLGDPPELSQTSGTKWYLKVSLTYIYICVCVFIFRDTGPIFRHSMYCW